MRFLRVARAAAAVAPALVVAAAPIAIEALVRPARDAALAQMYRDHDWFALRTAMRRRDAPPLYVGAVAAAFNRTEDAESALRAAIREASNADAANEARGILAQLYIRVGRTSDAGAILDDILRVEPQRDDIRNYRELFGAFTGRPNQRVLSHGRARFSCTVRANGVSLPLSVNDRSVEWLLDTGANVTVVSESEAQRLGITTGEAGGRAADQSGGSAPFRAAVAARLVVAGTELRDVPVIVLPDERPPWIDLPPGRQGAIGLPAALALQRIRWTDRGSCEIGAPPARSTAPLNLAFEGLDPVIRVEIGRRTTEFLLDTGNQGQTQLWDRFAREFPALMKRGVRGMATVTQVGGSNRREVTVLSNIHLHVGGHNAALKTVNVFSAPVGNRRLAGNLGMEVLGQASSVTIDFRSMSIVLE